MKVFARYGITQKQGMLGRIKCEWGPPSELLWFPPGLNEAQEKKYKAPCIMRFDKPENGWVDVDEPLLAKVWAGSSTKPTKAKLIDEWEGLS